MSEEEKEKEKEKLPPIIIQINEDGSTGMFWNFNDYPPELMGKLISDFDLTRIIQDSIMKELGENKEVGEYFTAAINSWKLHNRNKPSLPLIRASEVL